MPIWSDPQTIQTSLDRSAKFRQERDLEDKFVVLYSGNMARFHDIQSILDASKLLDHDDRFHFLFVGDGYHASTVQHFIKNNPSCSMSIEGYVARADLGACLGAANAGLVSLLPNHVGLSVPSKTMGLLAAGIPVLGILPSDSEIAHVINDNKTGAVVPPFSPDELVKILLKWADTPSLTDTYSKNAKHASHTIYSMSEISTQFLSVIRPKLDE